VNDLFGLLYLEHGDMLVKKMVYASCIFFSRRVTRNSHRGLGGSSVKILVVIDVNP
jgi:hypothetical protein